MSLAVERTEQTPALAFENMIEVMAIKDALEDYFDSKSKEKDFDTKTEVVPNLIDNCNEVLQMFYERNKGETNNE